MDDDEQDDHDGNELQFGGAAFVLMQEYQLGAARGNPELVRRIKLVEMFVGSLLRNCDSINVQVVQYEVDDKSEAFTASNSDLCMLITYEGDVIMCHYINFHFQGSRAKSAYDTEPSLSIPPLLR